MSTTRVAAIWWRVSTDDQKEISPETQVSEAKALAEKEGYSVPDLYVLGTDWHSLTVWESPPMERLKELIRGHAIQAVFMYDPDRSPSRPVHRLLLRALCEENGVKIRACHGQVPEGDMGELMEFLSAWSKEKSVLRAQQGAKDGLRDRAKLKGLPPVPKHPYGYTWDKARSRLIPTTDWPTAQFICRAGLHGMPTRSIVKALHDKGIATATGREWWVPRTVHWILTSPIYGGRYYALRQTSVEPKRRAAETYGKSSNRLKPLEEAVHLASIVIEQPPLTWQEWLSLQDRLKANQRQAQRNAKRDYLLRSLIICDSHRRRYHGEKRGQRWVYACSTTTEHGHGPCPRPILPSLALEEQVKALCRSVLESPDVIERELRLQQGVVKGTTESLERNLANLKRREARNLEAEANLLLSRARGDASPEAYERALARLKAERAWTVEERQRLQDQLDAAKRGESLALSLAQARERLEAKLQSASNEDWRMVLNALGVEVHVDMNGQAEVSMAIPLNGHEAIVSHTPGGEIPHQSFC